MSWDGPGGTEDVLVAWVLRGSGLAPGQVIWAGQPETNRPIGQHIELDLKGVDRTGLDGFITEENPDASPGSELLLRTTGTRSFVLSITCYGGDAVGIGRPALVLAGVVAQSTKESQYAIWSAAGLAVWDFDAVSSVNGKTINGTYIEPLASTIFKFRASPDALPEGPPEIASSVEHVRVTPNGNDAETFQVDKTV